MATELTAEETATVDLARGMVDMLRKEHATDGHDDLFEDLVAIIDRLTGQTA